IQTRGMPFLCDHSVRASRQAPRCLPAQTAPQKPMKKNKFPPGWDADRVRRVLEHYEAQGEEEAVAEDEAAFEAGQTVVKIPTDLLPAVRELLAKRKAS